MPAASDREAGAAAAACGGVGVVDLESLADQVVDEIDLRAAEIGEGDRVDEDGSAVPLDDEVVRCPRLVEIEAILEAGAAAARHADAECRAAGLAAENFG